MKTKIYILMALISTSISCKDFVQVDPPKQKMVTKAIFGSDQTANAAMMAVYTSLNQNPGFTFQLSLYSGVYSDELLSHSIPGALLQAYQNSMSPLDASSNTIWNVLYNVNYQANAMQEGVSISQSISTAVQKQLTGEALFIRAFAHFYLLNLFGNIPVITSTDYSVSAATKQSTAEAVYKQIVDDLLKAKELLSVNYVSGDGISSSTERVRPNKSTVSAFLSRVYLYQKQWSQAETEATVVINLSQDFEMVPINDTFKIGSKEAIWQFQMPTPISNRNTYDGSFYVLTNKPNIGLQNSSTISTQLLQAFELNDLRRSWIGMYTDTKVTPAVDYLFPFKYKVQNTATITERNAIIRLAELYLIRSEARSELNNLTGAIKDIDVIRKRAGLPLIESTNPGINKTDLMKAIEQERRIELFTEWAHRWMDLKRTGRADEVMGVVSPQKGGSWNPNKKLWPIPQTEIERARQLIQNPGYEL